MICNIRDHFPSWRRNGPWPYELGVAVLILWLAESIRHLDDVRARYIITFFLWDWVDDHPGIYMLALWCIALMIIVGFAVRCACPRCSVVMRVGGMLSAGTVYGIIAFSFLYAYPWSVGGGAYLFLSWRAFAVSIAVMHRYRRLFRAAYPS